MAQRQKLRKRLQERTAKHGVPPPLSIKLTTMGDLPKKSKPWSNHKDPVDILLLTVEDCEFVACYTYMRNSFKSYHKDLGFVYFGNMGESEDEPLNVALMRCSEGSSVPNGSQTVTKNAVMQLRPKLVYSVGCCEGLNPEDTNLGDVVISSKLTTGAFKIPVGRDISKLIKNASDGWNPPLKSPAAHEVQVHGSSEILSGIDPFSTERHLSELNPDAIAVETEGKGIFVAAHDLKIEWVIVKGISHFADDSNAADKSWKSYACVMAASLVSNMLSDPVVFQDWPHYEDMQSVQKESSTSYRKEEHDKHAGPSTSGGVAGASGGSKQDSKWLGECQRQLRTIYSAVSKVKIVPWDRTSAVHIDDVYTELSWLKDARKPRGVTQEKLEHYSDLFSNGKRLLVYGRPGIGKTVFTQKATFDWAQQQFKEKLGTFELVLLVKLRDVCDLQDVPAILRASNLLPSDGKISVDELYDYVCDHQEKVLLILDGFDEYNAGSQSPVREIWERRQLRDCCVVITTRQTKADELRFSSDAQFQINGFDSERRKEFAQKFLKHEDVEPFLEYLKQQDLKEVAEIPLLLLMLCLLWQEKGKDRTGLPTSRAKIYAQFIETLFHHVCDKNPDAVKFRKVDDYSDELYKLGSLAFDALLQDCLYFPLSKLPDHDLIKKLIDVGLFHILNMSSLNRDRGVYFLHKSLQEYMASWFLKEELLYSKGENASSLSKVDSIENALKVAEVLKFSCELSEEAARKILNHLEMVAKKEGLSEYKFTETPSYEDLSAKQKDFVILCAQCFFSCSAETRRDLFPAFLSHTQRVLFIHSRFQLYMIADEHLLKTTEPPKYIFCRTMNYYCVEVCYSKFINVAQDLNAVVVTSSGEEKASEFLKKHSPRLLNQFFLKKEQNTHLYFTRIDNYNGPPLPFPTKMLKELVAAPKFIPQKKRNPDAHQSSEQDNKTGLVLTKNSDVTSCSAHCLSMVRVINAVKLDSSQVEVVIDVLALVIAPLAIQVEGKDGETFDAQLTKTLVKNIKYTNRLEVLTLDKINMTAKLATTIAKSLHKVPNLSHLSMSWNPLGEGLNDLIGQLGCVPRLKSLHFVDVMMTKEQVHDLTTAVRRSNISDFRSSYHDKKGDPIPEEEWDSEDDWKRRYPSLFREDEKGNPRPENEWRPEEYWKRLYPSLFCEDDSSESKREQDQEEGDMISHLDNQVSFRGNLPQSEEPLATTLLDSTTGISGSETSQGPVSTAAASSASTSASTAASIAPTPAPTAPTAAPTAPTAAPTAPIAAPTAPIATPTAPIATTTAHFAARTASPTAPTAGPTTPNTTPIVPIAAFNAPIPTLNAPSTAPTASTAAHAAAAAEAGNCTQKRKKKKEKRSTAQRKKARKM